MQGKARDARSIGPGRGSGYLPPGQTLEIDTSELGFQNGFLLKFPRLYAAGDVSLLELPAVAVVGSRAASPEGLRRAEQLARDLVRAGVVVMSGLALGVDTAAHRAALAHGGRTLAVLGTSLEKAYPPENAELQQRIYEQHLLLSPFQPGTKTYPNHFPARNRVMAHLARATVIIEAGDTSGTLHQATASVEHQRPLFIAASVVANPNLTWPARFVGKPGVQVLRSTAQVIEVVTSSRSAAGN